jgi:polyferredoxin
MIASPLLNDWPFSAVHYCLLKIFAIALASRSRFFHPLLDSMTSRGIKRPLNYGTSLIWRRNKGFDKEKSKSRETLIFIIIIIAIYNLPLSILTLGPWNVVW